jgi:DNA-binding response OmpR family regulator
MGLNSNTNNNELDATDQLRVHILANEPSTQTVSALLAACDFSFSVSEEVSVVHSQLLTRTFDVVVLSMDVVSSGLCEAIRRLQPHASMVMVAAEANVSELTIAMRAGATDVLVGPPSAEEIEDRVREAGVRSRDGVERERRSDKLRGLSRRIGDTREQLLQAIEVHEQTPEETPEETPEQTCTPDLSASEMAAEFSTLLRDELDVEELLRTSLEFLLHKSGPTNAALFLSGSNNAFGLGAYVHYDLPRKDVEPMLQRLADEACPAISDSDDVLRFEDSNEFIAQCNLGPDVATHQQMIAVPCHHDGECLAVLILFRDESKVFDEKLAMVLDILRQIFADQLGRVIAIHNRMLPEWPEEPEDDFDGGGGTTEFE